MSILKHLGILAHNGILSQKGILYANGLLPPTDGFADYYQWLPLGLDDDLVNKGTGLSPVDGLLISGSMATQDIVFDWIRGDAGLQAVADAYGIDNPMTYDKANSIDMTNIPEDVFRITNSIAPLTDFPPFWDDMISFWDGTVIKIDGVYSFLDRKGVGNLLITDYDFDSDNGFPYKTFAKVSAPVGNTALINADVSNFFYDESGTPNLIPVISFFQNVDFSGRLFSRHEDQILSEGGLENYESRVKDIALYATEKTGSDLIVCNEFFEVPTKETAIWVDVLGNDTTGAGTEISPVATITRALQFGGSNIYVKTGVYDAGSTFFDVNTVKNIEAIGSVSFENPSLNYQFLLRQSATIKGFNLTHSLGGAYPFFAVLGGGSEVNIIKCYVDNYNYLYNGGEGTNGIHFLNCLGNFANSTTSIMPVNSRLFSFIEGKLYLKSTVRNIYYNYAGGNGIINVKYNSIEVGNSTDFITVSKNLVELNIEGNQLINLTGLGFGNAAIDDFNFKNNVGKFQSVSMLGTGNINYVIDGNNLDSSHYDVKIDILNKTGVVANNIINNTGLGGFVRVESKISTINVQIDGNRLIADGDGITGVSIGVEDSALYANYITGSFKGNYIEQKNPTPGNVHGPQFLNNNFDVRFNHTKGIPLGLVFKGTDFDCSTSVMNYNLIEEGYLLLKGVSNLKVFGNTVKNEELGICVYLLGHEDDPSFANNIIKNNIFEYTGSDNTNAVAYIALGGHTNTIDNNVYYYPNSDNIGYIQGTKYETLSEWQAQGFEANGVVQNPLLDANLIPSIPIEIGENLGVDYEEGLSGSTYWGDENTLPTVATTNQYGAWKLGAYLDANTPIVPAIIPNLAFDGIIKDWAANPPSLELPSLDFSDENNSQYEPLM